MQIEFDPEKDAKNIDLHGVSLAEAERFDLRSAKVEVDDRHDYGEVRMNAFGRLGGTPFVMTFVVRDERVRVISLRPAEPEEIGRNRRRRGQRVKFR